MEQVQVGDMISVPGRIGVIRHFGIFAGFANGVASVIHNSKQQRRVVVEPWQLFAEGKPVKIERRAADGLGGLVVQAALQWLGTQYDLMGFNCEHFVTAVHDGRAKSPQLAGWTAAGIVGLFALALSSGSRSSYDPTVDRYRDRSGRFSRR